MALFLGLWMLVCPACDLSAIAEVVAALTGGAGASPAMLIVTGLGLIGLRDKMERMSPPTRYPYEDIPIEPHEWEAGG